MSKFINPFFDSSIDTEVEAITTAVDLAITATTECIDAINIQDPTAALMEKLEVALDHGARVLRLEMRLRFAIAGDVIQVVLGPHIFERATGFNDFVAGMTSNAQGFAEVDPATKESSVCISSTDLEHLVHELEGMKEALGECSFDADSKRDVDWSVDHILGVFDSLGMRIGFLKKKLGAGTVVFDG